MKLKTVQVENFGPYKHTQFDLHGGFSVIRGNNLAGKSWVGRAVVWAMFDKGASFDKLQREEGKPVNVTLSFDDGRALVRERTTGRNNYILISPDGSKQQLTAGRGANPEVLNFIGVSDRPLANNWQPWLQYQGEHDPVFLLGESAKVQESALARVVGADVLERSVSIVHSDLTSIVRNVKSAKTRVSEVGDQVALYDGLKDIEKFCELAENAQKIADSCTTKLDVAKRCVPELQAVDARIAVLEQGLPTVKIPDTEPVEALATSTAIAGIIISKYQGTVKGLAAAQSQYDAVSWPELPANIDANVAQLSLIRQYIDLQPDLLNKQAQCDAVGGYISVAGTIIEEAGVKLSTISQCKELLTMAQRCGTLDKEIDDTAKLIATSENDIANLRYDMGICPTCGQETRGIDE